MATGALSAFLRRAAHRPLYARAASDNRGSIRVLEKCGCSVVGRERGFANARGAEIEEVVFELVEFPEAPPGIAAGPTVRHPT